jgi:hypothetical protein
MIDAIAAATTAVALITPALAEIAKGAAGHLGELADDKLLRLLRNKLTGPAHVALTALAARPDSEARQSVLREELIDLLRQEPALLADLAALLPANAASHDITTQTIHGDGAIGVVNKGNANTVTIR